MSIDDLSDFEVVYAVGAAIAGERALLRADVRTSPAELEQLLDPDYTEIGASGRLWHRADMIAALLAEPSDGDPIADSDMNGTLLTPELVLLTYVSDRAGRRARRSSLWRRTDGHWRVLFHQGTVLPAAEADEPATVSAASWLESVEIDAAVLALRPDYRAVVLVAEGLRGGPSDDASDAMLMAATAAASELVAAAGSPDAVPHVAAWRAAYRAFGAKPQRTRPSVEALLRRLDAVPRIDRITDVYNAISIEHAVPIGGEDLDAYAGSARLVRATGDETFETTAGGEASMENPDTGEVIWRDDRGVTCRRWNWRQSPRTRITTSTSRAVFILDGLAGHDLEAAADALEAALRAGHPQLSTQRRTIG